MRAGEIAAPLVEVSSMAFAPSVSMSQLSVYHPACSVSAGPSLITPQGSPLRSIPSGKTSLVRCMSSQRRAPRPFPSRTSSTISTAQTAAGMYFFHCFMRFSLRQRFI